MPVHPVRRIMNICEGCIKQDVCKFKEVVGRAAAPFYFPEPLEVTCKYKEIEDECPDNPFWDSYWPSNVTWPYCGTTRTCGKEW